jgi:hypothetical protein
MKMRDGNGDENVQKRSLQSFLEKSVKIGG